MTRVCRLTSGFMCGTIGARAQGLCDRAEERPNCIRLSRLSLVDCCVAGQPCFYIRRLAEPGRGPPRFTIESSNPNWWPSSHGDGPREALRGLSRPLPLGIWIGLCFGSLCRSFWEIRNNEICVSHSRSDSSIREKQRTLFFLTWKPRLLY